MNRKKKNKIDEKIKCIFGYLNNPYNKTNGIDAINKIFSFINEENTFDMDDGNYYLFVANVKIKSMAFLCRTYSFIKKYEGHEKEEWKKRIGDEVQAVKDNIADKLKNEKELKEIIIAICEANQQVNELNEYKIIENRVVLKTKEDNEKTEYYKFTKEQADVLNLAFKVKENKNIDISKLDQITEMLQIENKVTDILSQQKMAEIIEKNNENRSLRYFIFDNSMREVDFFGIESRFNWLWESEQDVCLYRNVTKKEINPNTCDFESKKGMDYMRKLMSRIISHASGDYKEAISYSRNPIRDIYKYIDLNHDTKPLEIVFSIDVKDGQFVLNVKEAFDEENKAIFEFIGKATTNNIRTYNGDSLVEKSSFYKYLKLPEDKYNKTKYCIEFCKENAIVPPSSGRRLTKLNDYLHTWGINDNFMFSRVSDNDDEVITSIDYFSDAEKKVYELKFVDILTVLYKIYFIEDKIDDDVLKENIRERIKKEYKEQLSKEKIKNEINLRGGVTIKMDIPEDMDEAIRTMVMTKRNEEIPKKIASIIIDKISSNMNSSNANEVINAINQGIGNKTHYQNARKEEFNFYVGQNEILTFWKQLFKGLVINV